MEALERGLVLAKQVLSQLSYTPTVGVAFILMHFPGFQNFGQHCSMLVPKTRLFKQTLPRKRHFSRTDSLAFHAYSIY
jgi:hypothetical protein